MHQGQPGQDGIAIIGMACLFPGAPSVDAYWQNILGKVDAVTDPPPEAWDTSVSYDPSSSDSDRVYCKRGGYLGSLVAFDPLPHGIPPIAVGGEPDQWLALQMARDALADAGYTELPGRVRQRTAVILGKGTYLNGGNALAVQHGLVVGQTVEILRQLHPEYSEAHLERIRQELREALPPMRPEIVPALIPNIMVGRIANRLDLMGPTYTVDAACASSLLAIQLAMRDLRNGECDLALVGGAQVWVPVPTLNVFCQVGALSRSQQIRPFGKDADGTLLGEGIGMVVAKRLEDAERDGDRIYAVIRGVGVSSDGRGVSVMAPRVEGEVLALERAYQAAGLSPGTVGLIEAHGTGTPVGDVVEVQALRQVFGARQGELPTCALGSVKSMISHTMPAAGVAGLIKVALALYHKVLPPTLCSEPNPKLELEKTPFYLNTETRPWIHGGSQPRRAGVNAFGFGGINAHVVVEEYTGERAVRIAVPGRDSTVSPRPAPDHLPAWESEVCILEGESSAELQQQIERLDRFLATRLEDGPAAGEPLRLTDLAFTLNTSLRNAPTDLHLAVVASSPADLRAKLERAARRLAKLDCRQIKDVSGIYFAAEPLGRQGKLAFLFPGEGSQYPNMLADLCLHFPEVRECFDQLDRVFDHHPRGYVTSDFVFPRALYSERERIWAEQHLGEIDGAIEAVLTANHAIFAIMERLELQPDAMVGHSTGELSALRAAGVLDSTNEGRLSSFVLELNQDYQDIAAQDGVPRAVLLAVGADRERLEAIAREAGGEIYVAMDNCPHQTVLVGRGSAVERALEIIQREGLIYERLFFDRAYHTPLFAPYAEHLRRIFAQAPMLPPRVELYSCTTVAPYPSDPDEIRELALEHWVRPVEFRRTVEALYEAGARLFVEVGPRGNLSAFVEDTLRGQTFCAIPANVQRRSDITQLNHLVGLLAAHGVVPNLRRLYDDRAPRTVDWQASGGNPASAPAGHPIGLSVTWAMLRLPPEAAARLRQEAGARNGAGAVTAPVSIEPMRASEPAPSQAPVQPPPAPEVEVAPVLPAVSTPSAELAVAPADDPAGTLDLEAGGGIQSTMEAHFQTMGAFLATQEQVVQAYLQAVQQAAPAGREAPLYPLLGTVVAWTPESELVAERSFDPDEDLYLRDHTLGRGVSASDPTLLALAVMPLTMSLEILAEAAACLLPGRMVIGLRDVRAYRWLAWDGEPQTIQVSAQRLPGEAERVQVQLRNLTEDRQTESPPRSPVLEATVLLGEGYPAPPPVALPGLPDGRPSRWSAERLYREAMFHGPAWQGVAAMDQVGRHGALTRLRVLPFDGFFRSIQSPCFVLDPVTLDAAGQVIGFWAAEQLARGKIIFPFLVQALELYGPPRPAGEVVTCGAAIELIGDQQVCSDIDLVTADGRPWMRLVGWQDKRFDLPDPFQRLMSPLRQLGLSTPWPEPISQLAEWPPLACRRLSFELSSDQAFWARVWAQRVLSRSERDEFRRLPGGAAEQLAWLAERTVAKEAVQELLRTQAELELPLADLELHQDEQGLLQARGAWRAQVAGVPRVAVARAAGWAVALAVLAPAAGLPVWGGPLLPGVQLAPIDPTQPDSSEPCVSRQEQALLTNVPADRRVEWEARCRAAKQAVARALGAAEGAELEVVELVSTDVERGLVALLTDERLRARVPDLPAAPLVVATSRHGELVIATTLCQPLAPKLAGSGRGQTQRPGTGSQGRQGAGQ